jgi:O-antigen/teichoic acid export membrane protein
VGGRDISLSQPLYVSESNTATLNALRPGWWQQGTVVCSTITSVGIYMILARALGPQTFGSYLFVQWLATVTIPIIGTAMSPLASQQIATIQSKEAPRQIAGIFYFLWYRQHRSIFFYCILYISLAFMLSRFFHIFAAGLLLLAGLSTLPLLLSAIAGITLRSLRRADILAMLNLFGVLLNLLFIIIATQVNGKPVEAYLLAFALSNTLTLILAIICIIRLLPLENALAPGIFLQERLTQSLHHSWFKFALDTIIWQRGELLLLALWCRPTELGFYALSAFMSTKVIEMTPALFSRWLFPFILRYIPEHRYLNPYDAFVRTTCYIIFLAVPICTIMISLCPLIVKEALGDAYLPLVQPLRILLIAAVFGSIATVSLTRLIQNQHTRKHDSIRRLQGWLNVGIALLKIVLALPLIFCWGTIGAAFASAIAQITSAIVTILLCKKALIKHETVL